MFLTSKNNKNLYKLYYKTIYRSLFKGIVFIRWYSFWMSKRYSGKSFKDSSAAKKPKLSLKEKRKNKKEKSKKS